MAGIDPDSLNQKDKKDLIDLIQKQDARLQRLESDRNRGKTPTDPDADKTLKGASGIVNAFDPASLANIQGVMRGMKDALLGVINLTDFETFKELDELSNTIQQNFGLARGRVSEFKTAIADAAPELAKMGYTQEETTDLIADTMDGLKTSALLNTETLVEMGAVAKVTGLDVKDLAADFKSVGISMENVGKEMKGVADYAKNVGLSVKAISSGVQQNMEKLNLYNFDNGVQGLAKMAASSERFGISMQDTFRLAEELFSPENAINLAAGLQRLGVASSALLDPLRAMDLAQNDPEALQKEIVNLSKEFTTFNEKTGKMEILPGGQRRLREIANELKIDAGEFAKMSIQAADFDRKLSQIRMPALAEGDQETRELIASMANLDASGVATIQVKDMETGQITEKKVEELTPDDIVDLKNANEESSKSIEQIAIDQLDVTKQINATIQSGELMGKFARATSPTMEKLTNFVAGSYKDVANSFRDELGTTQGLRQKFEGVAAPTEDFFVASIEGNATNIAKAISDFEKGAMDIKDSFMSASESFVSNIIQNRTEDLKRNYSTEYEGVNQTKTLIYKHEGTITVKGEGDLKGYMNMDLTDPNTQVNLKNAIESTNAPSAATGKKN
jgi:hypothetical protein